MLLALFLFSLGFAALFDLTKSAASESRQAADFMGGANLAQAKLDRLAARSWRENIVCQACIPGETVAGSEGKYHWLIRSDWDDTPQLLRVSVEVYWSEDGTPSSYKLESLYAVE